MNTEDENVVSDLFDDYSETQKEILALEIRKTRNKLLAVAALIFFFDLFALLLANALTVQTLLWILVVPAVIGALAFLALKEPLAAMIIASVLIVGLWVYVIIITGGLAAITGWVAKAIIIYLLIAGFQHAREAARIKREFAGSP